MKVTYFLNDGAAVIYVGVNALNNIKGLHTNAYAVRTGICTELYAMKVACIVRYT